MPASCLEHYFVYFFSPFYIYIHLIYSGLIWNSNEYFFPFPFILLSKANTKKILIKNSVLRCAVFSFLLVESLSLLNHLKKQLWIIFVYKLVAEKRLFLFVFFFLAVLFGWFRALVVHLCEWFKKKDKKKRIYKILLFLSCRTESSLSLSLFYPILDYIKPFVCMCVCMCVDPTPKSWRKSS